MPDYRVLRETVRSLRRDGREFVLTYSLAVRDTDDGPLCAIQASLMERTSDGAGHETSCSVEMPHIRSEAIAGVFETIAAAEDPVFPVHVPDIVRDRLSLWELLAVRDLV